MLALLGPDLGAGGLSVLLLGLFGGLLALDDTALGQTWFSQPLPAGILTGAFCGDAMSGLAIGLPVQMVLAGNLPVGQCFLGDHVTAIVAAVGATVLSGTNLVPALGAGPVAVVPFIGWMMLAVGLSSSGGHVLVQLERRAHSLWMLEGHLTLRDGRLERVDRIHARCLFTTFLRGFATTVLLLSFLLRWWIPAFNDLPAAMSTVLGMVPVLIPGLGVGHLIDRYGFRSSWCWVAVGCAVSFLVTEVVR